MFFRIVKSLFLLLFQTLSDVFIYVFVIYFAVFLWERVVFFLKKYDLMFQFMGFASGVCFKVCFQGLFRRVVSEGFC